MLKTKKENLWGKFFLSSQQIPAQSQQERIKHLPAV